MINPKIQNLANLMREKKRHGEKFVVMLGAGASMSSGVKNTPQIMKELLDLYGNGIDESLAVDARFDKLWERTAPGDREKHLKPYLDMQPSSGYEKLARLIEAEYIDVILTFNFDSLVEKSLKQTKVEPRVIVRGEIIEDQMQALLDAPEPRFKLVKLHGSVQGAKHFLFAAEEMLRYPDPVHTLVENITRRDIIMCGYAFEDVCVISAFSQSGGYVICVNPSGVPKSLRGFLPRRLSADLAVPMKFDDFFEQLHDELFATLPPPPTGKLTHNPFKFLESYEEADQESLFERTEESRNFLTLLEKVAPRLIVLAGPAKSGKTSLVKAGIIPALKAKQYRHVYLRCQSRPGGSSPLPGEVEKSGVIPWGQDFNKTLRDLAGREPQRHTVLFLDQFDRLTNGIQFQNPKGAKKLAEFLENEVFNACAENLTIVLVVTDESTLGGAINQAAVERDLSSRLVQCLAFDREQIITITNMLAKRAGIQFAPGIIEDMAKLYEESKSKDLQSRFTLAHVQAVCHLLARTPVIDLNTYQAFENMEVLHKAINVCNIISFVEDFSWPNSVWLRNMIKVPMKESKDKIAQYIMENYDELVPRSQAAEPITLEQRV
jgi:hypothetical protein